MGNVGHGLGGGVLGNLGGRCVMGLINFEGLFV